MLCSVDFQIEMHWTQSKTKEMELISDMWHDIILGAYQGFTMEQS